MDQLLNTPILGIILSVFAFQIGLYIFRKTKLIFLHPFVTSFVLIIFILLIFNIPLESYEIGGDMITFFLGPATVVLAVPLYRQINILKKNIIPILVGVVAGSAVGIISVIIIGKILRLPPIIIISLVPKSITNPIGVELCKQLGGDLAVTVCAIVFTGILGAIIGPLTCKIFKIKNPLAVGLSIGTSSHGIGTSRAIQLGETEGAMSGLAIGLAGLITVLLAPTLITWLM
ncbi:MAG: LrgB family protein [Syntrophomonadaceae bacterium]|nr:LrgB family protein [Syntrophomonadaceae bacterium]